MVLGAWSWKGAWMTLGLSSAPSFMGGLQHHPFSFHAGMWEALLKKGTCLKCCGSCVPTTGRSPCSLPVVNLAFSDVTYSSKKAGPFNPSGECLVASGVRH